MNEKTGYLLSEKIDCILQHAVSNKVIPGLVAAAATDDGIIYQGAVGTRGMDTDEPMTLDTAFWIRSMTKLPTCIAAMQLVEKGKLKLDDPVGKIVPELEFVNVLEGFSQDDQPILHPARSPITLRQLLNHTAGFAFDGWNEKIRKYVLKYNIPSITTGKNASINIPIVFDPGVQWEYGPNTEWVGKVVEAASGQSLREYFKEHIFSPLGMNDTDFILRPDIRQRLATVQVRKSSGELEVFAFEPCQTPEFYPGASGLYSTALDYMKLLRVMLHDGFFNGARILQSETVAMMRTNQIGDFPVTMLKGTNPMCIDTEFYPGITKKWGLADMLTLEELPTGRGAGSQFWAGGTNTFYWIDPTKRMVGVFFAHLYPFVDQPVFKTFTEFETEIYKEKK